VYSIDRRCIELARQTDQMPRASGQSRTAPELTIKWPVGFWNRKWS